jgi:hypothetical protein
MDLRFSAPCEIAAGRASQPFAIWDRCVVGGRGAHVGVTATRPALHQPLSAGQWTLLTREYHKPAARDARCELCAPGHVHFPASLALVTVLAIVIAMIVFNSH